jgi:hypothetical protein
VLVELGLVDLQDIADRLGLGDHAGGGGISDPKGHVGGRRSFEEGTQWIVRCHRHGRSPKVVGFKYDNHSSCQD